MKRILSSDGFFSDFDNEDIMDNDSLDVDDFFYYSDEILDIYEEIKERFSSSPFFLSHLTFPILSEFLFQLTIHKKINLQTIQKNNLNLFNDFYNVEIDYSYNMLNKFLRKFKFFLPHNLFIQFCFIYSDLYELKNLHSIC